MKKKNPYLQIRISHASATYFQLSLGVHLWALLNGQLTMCRPTRLRHYFEGQCTCCRRIVWIGSLRADRLEIYGCGDCQSWRPEDLHSKLWPISASLIRRSEWWTVSFNSSNALKFLWGLCFSNILIWFVCVIRIFPHKTLFSDLKMFKETIEVSKSEKNGLDLFESFELFKSPLSVA